MQNIINKEVWFHDEPFMVEARVTWSVDSSYGEDADGNRGESRLFVDDVEILSVSDLEGSFVQNEDLKKAIGDMLDVSGEDCCRDD